MPGASSNGSTGDYEDDEDDNDPVKQQLKHESLMPRTDISGELNDTLIDQMNEDRSTIVKKWFEAMNKDKVNTIL